MCIKYFSTDYREARDKFLAGARSYACRLHSYPAPFDGPDGQQLFLDVVEAGPEDAGNALVLMSGTHGVEGFAGSAIQSALLDGGLTERLPERTKVVLIHALNPYGFAFLRRVNEDNVDLNRNFVDHSAPYPENSDYRQLQDLLVPKTLHPMAEVVVMLKILRLFLTRGFNSLKDAVTYGQYSHPEGLFYGGHKEAWSNRTLREIVGRFLGEAQHVIVIDLHTGLGPHGVGELIMNEPVDDPAYQRACSWWESDRVKSTLEGESVSSRLSGTLKVAFDDMIPTAEVTGVGLEFGTLPPLKVFWALRAENWLHHYGGTSHPAAGKIKKRLLRAFYPDSNAWKKKIMLQGQNVVDQALSALAS